MQDMTFPQLRIHLIDYAGNIHPWIQRNLYTPFWRYYWNPLPGGFLDSAGGTVELTPECVTVIPGYLVFSTRAEQPFSQYYIHFNPPELLVPPERRIHRIPLKPEWRERWEEFRRLLPEPAAAFRRSLIAESLLLAALLELPPQNLALAPAADPRIARVRREISERMADPPDNAELAAMLGLNRGSFIRLFRQECGESPGRFSRRLRIEHGCKLLHYSRRSIEEIAEQCGFADRYHFTRVFSAQMHCSPAVFRRLAAGNAEGGASPSLHTSLPTG